MFHEALDYRSKLRESLLPLCMEDDTAKPLTHSNGQILALAKAAWTVVHVAVEPVGIYP